jgi:hypothetical protein
VCVWGGGVVGVLGLWVMPPLPSPLQNDDAQLSSLRAWRCPFRAHLVHWRTGALTVLSSTRWSGAGGDGV